MNHRLSVPHLCPWPPCAEERSELQRDLKRHREGELHQIHFLYFKVITWFFSFRLLMGPDHRTGC